MMLYHRLQFRRRVEALALGLLVFGAVTLASPRCFAQMGISALPTMLRVPILEQRDRVRLMPSVAYGFTESVLNEGDRHHRVAGGGGVAASLASGFALELRMDARYDRHVVGKIRDAGAVFDARALGRYSRDVNDRLSLGAQLGVWLPGEKPSKPAFRATTLDALAILGFKATKRLSLTVNAGYRLNQSAKSVSQPERLSPADSVGLGLSDFDALLFGTGVQQSFGKVRCFAEVSADILLGKKAPSFSQSPLRAALGASLELGRPTTRGTLVAEGLLSRRAAVDVNGPLIPFEPRFSLIFGVSQDFGWGDEVVVKKKAPAAAPIAKKPAAATPPAPPAPSEPSEPPEPSEPALPLGVLRVVVRDTDHGEAIAARVRVKTAKGEAVDAEQKPGPRGGIEVELAPGEYDVEISADGFASQRRHFSIDEHGVTVMNIDLRPKKDR